MPSPDPTRVILGYRTQTDRLRSQLVAYLERLWGSLSSWRDDDIARLVDQVIPVAEGAQQTVAALTAAYLAALESAATGEPVRPTPVDRATVTTEALRGAPAAEVYRRVGVTIWTALARGEELPPAVNTAGARLVNIATTGVQLAKTHTSRNIIEQNPRIVGYRRVLEGSRSCGLCVVASTQRYRKSDLLPIHGGCDCGVAPIYGTVDPGRVIDPERLDGAYEAITERFGNIDSQSRSTRDAITRYQDVLIVHEHGELGPVLGIRGQAFTGPNDI